MQKTKLTFDGQEHVLDQPRFGDLVAFERQFGLKASALEPKPVLDEHGQQVVDEESGEPVMKAEVALEWLAFLFWRALRRQGVITKDLPFDDDFVDRIEGVEMIDEGEEDNAADPSVPAPQPG